MPEETEVTIISQCKVTYFIGKLLAKAGSLILRKDGLLFSPATLDRALGAINIPIPLEDIEAFYYSDTFQKTLQIKTPSQIHRFIGGGLNEIHENLIILKRKLTSPTKPVPPTDSLLPRTKTYNACFNCSKPIQPTFKYCPYCRSQLKLICPSCRETIEETWIVCPYCNTELKKS